MKCELGHVVTSRTPRCFGMAETVQHHGQLRATNQRKIKN